MSLITGLSLDLLTPVYSTVMSLVPFPSIYILYNLWFSYIDISKIKEKLSSNQAFKKKFRVKGYPLGFQHYIHKTNCNAVHMGTMVYTVFWYTGIPDAFNVIPESRFFV